MPYPLPKIGDTVVIFARGSAIGERPGRIKGAIHGVKAKVVETWGKQLRIEFTDRLMDKLHDTWTGDWDQDFGSAPKQHEHLQLPPWYVCHADMWEAKTAPAEGLQAMIDAQNQTVSKQLSRSQEIADGTFKVSLDMTIGDVRNIAALCRNGLIKPSAILSDALAAINEDIETEIEEIERSLELSLNRLERLMARKEV